MIKRFQDYLYKPILSTQLGLFRILFGLCLVYELFYYFNIDLLDKGLRAPAMRFTYEGFEWIKLLPGKSMEVILFLLLVAAVCITLGIVYRIATIFFFTFFTYLFFIDKSLYNNHLYLFVLLCFLLTVVKGDAALSVTKKNQSATIPQWQLLLLKIQIFIVYFYGGLAKLNADWLIRHEPMHSMLQSSYSSSTVENLLVYGGLLFDLSIGFLLWNKRTRLMGVVGVVFFNISNAIIFNDIGVFPFFMLAATVLFFNPETINRVMMGTKTQPKKDGKKIASSPKLFLPSSKINWLIGVYLTFQLLFPFRYLLFPGNAEWYGVGQRFSWRMKIQSRQVKELKYTVVDYDHKQLMDLDPSQYLTAAQIQSLYLDPKMILQFAQFLASDATKKGLTNIAVKSKVKVVFNGRPEQYVINPETDLSKLNYHPYDLRNWVLPLKN